MRSGRSQGLRASQELRVKPSGDIDELHFLLRYQKRDVSAPFLQEFGFLLGDTEQENEEGSLAAGPPAFEGASLGRQKGESTANTFSMLMVSMLMVAASWAPEWSGKKCVKPVARTVV